MKDEAQKIKTSLFSELQLDTRAHLNSGDYVTETLENLNTLLLEKEYLFSYFYNLEKDANISSLIYNKNLSEIDFSIFYSLIINKAIKFPIAYLLKGLFYPNDFTQYLFINSNFLKLSEKMFNEFYLTTENPLETGKDLFIEEAFLAYNKYIFEDLYETFPTTNGGTFKIKEYSYLSSDIETAIENVSTKLISMISTIQTMLSSEEFSQFMFSIDENQDNILEFLKVTLNFFLSYTTKLYDVKYLNIYKSESESFPFAEDLNIKLKQEKVDYFFVDDKLTLREEE